jgi:peptide/nickel transport system permease protein
VSLSYLLRRAGTTLLVLAGVSMLTFAIVPLLPGSPARVMLGVQATPEAVQALERRMGLDRPIALQYLTWIGGVLRGDFGSSLISRQPIRPEIARRLPASLLLATAALIVGLAIALPAGFAAALRPGSGRDAAISVASQLGVSIPDFWLGILLVVAFSETLGWLPSSGYRPLGDGIVPFLRHLILPALTAGIVSGAIMTRFVRSALLEVIGQDFVRTAHAKGIRPGAVLRKHVLRNAAIPIVTIVGLQMATLLSAVVVVEIIFAWPGLGQLALTATLQRDYPALQAAVLLSAIIFTTVNLLVDLSYSLLDPRVRTV